MKCREYFFLHECPHQNNGHPLLQNTYMGENLFLCNTETATEHPGYMEEAEAAANMVFRKIK